MFKQDFTSSSLSCHNNPEPKVTHSQFLFCSINSAHTQFFHEFEQNIIFFFKDLNIFVCKNLNL